MSTKLWMDFGGIETSVTEENGQHVNIKYDSTVIVCWICELGTWDGQYTA